MKIPLCPQKLVTKAISECLDTEARRSLMRVYGYLQIEAARESDRRHGRRKVPWGLGYEEFDPRYVAKWPERKGGA